MFKLMKKPAAADKEAKQQLPSLPSKPGTPAASAKNASSTSNTSSRPVTASHDSLADSKVSLNSPSSSAPNISKLSLSDSAASSTASSSATQQRQDINGTLTVRVIEGRKLDLPFSLSRADSPLPYVVVEFDKMEVVANAREWDREEDAVIWNYRSAFDVSRKSELFIGVYQRDPNGGRDKLVGSTTYAAELSDQSLQEEWVNLSVTYSDDPANPVPAGSVRIQSSFRTTAASSSSSTAKPKPLSMEDFDLLKVIGKGSFGKVMQVRKKDTNKIYAMKIIKKSHIVERAEVSHTLAERMVLSKINHPFIVPLKYTFQSSEKLYLVLAFVNGGELFHHLQSVGRFDETRARFYAAELLCALECLHSFDVIYRDLKPENILLDFSGHIALCDFGLCKLNMKDGNKTNTFCGTPEYLAPEVLIGKGYTKSVDWWTLGILLYEMLTGLPPFYDENVNDMYRKILKEELRFPEGDEIIGSSARDLLRGLLDRDPAARLGANSVEDIKRHRFFAEIDWKRLMARKYVPPFRPDVASATDTSNFDSEFTSEVPKDTYADSSALTASDQAQFEGFSYRNDNNMAGSVAGSFMGANSGIGGGGGVNRQASGNNFAGSFRGAGSMRK